MPLERIEGVLEVHDPDVGHAPLVFDSPHSGTAYPANHRIVAPRAALESGVDLYVHELFGTAPSHGAALLHALFPRMYIDPNRAEQDIDPALIEGDWPHPLNPTEKSERGFGLIRRLALPDVPVYDRPLPAAEIQMRLDRYYRPYHTTLVRLLDQRLDWYGAVWHVNCHSMKPVGNAMNDDAGAKRPDIVLGDRMGTSCDRAFAAFVGERLEAEGLTVVFNKPYQGAELTHAYSDPSAGRHSLQIEINRGLYMTEDTLERSAGFGALAAALDRLAGSLAAFSLDQAGRL